VMPNIKVLGKLDHSMILEAIQASNDMKIEREAQRSEVGAAVNAGAGWASPDR